MKCNNCGNEFEGKFCPECGTPAEPVEQTCPNCGSIRQNNEKFCSECGYQWDKSETDEENRQPLNGQQTDDAQTEKPASLQPQAVKQPATAPSTPLMLNSKPKKKNLTIPLLLGIYGVLFIAFVIMGIFGGHGARTAAVTLLAISGCAEIITGIVFYCLYKHRARFTCPVCGGIREKHREYLDSREKVVDNEYLHTITLYHRYRYTYECPVCGETREEIKEEGGGEYKHDYKTGRATDSRKPHYGDY